MKNWVFIIFLQKLESLTANSICHQLVWRHHQCWRHLISVKRTSHYQGTVVQKRLAIGQEVKTLDQKSRGGGGGGGGGGVQRTPPYQFLKGLKSVSWKKLK